MYTSLDDMSEKEKEEFLANLNKNEKQVEEMDARWEDEDFEVGIPQNLREKFRGFCRMRMESVLVL